MTPSQIKEILSAHSKWWDKEESGVRANLRSADLSDADLSDANLSGANLRGANLIDAHGANPHIKCIQIDTYAITYTSDVMQIGCERHTIAEWASFSDAQIRAMDGVKALAWWQKYKDWIFQTIALCPAAPTNPAKEAA